MLNYQFYCRPCRVDKKGLSPIELSVVILGKRKFIFLPRKEEPKQFKILLSSKDNNDLKQFLDGIRNQIHKAQNHALLTEQPLTHELIEEYVRYGCIKQYTINELVTAFLNQQMAKVAAGDCTEGVYQKYVRITNHFFNYIGKNMPCSSITPTHIEVFSYNMKQIYVASTWAGQMIRLKSVFTFGVENNYLQTNPFKIKIQKPKPKIEYLTDDELQALRTKDLHNERLDKIRDLAVFQCGSGLSYADLANLKPNDIQTSEEGIKYIYKERQKTGIYYTSVLLPCAVYVLEKYNYVLPIISNQRYNSYLKEIQTLCRIDKTLTTHIFRKTYSMHLLNSGVRIDVVASAMGHSNTRITQQAYAYLKKNTVVNEIASVMLQ